MPKLSRLAGQTSQMVDIFVQDSSSTTGSGLAGLTNATSGLTCYYHRNTASSSVSVSLASPTLGTFTSGGFITVDGTHMPGVYQLGIPNAALAAGADSVVLYLFGATNMAPVILEIDLTKYDPLNGNNLGLVYLTQGPMQLKKNQALAAFQFAMFDSTGAPKTGLTVLCQRAIDTAVSFSSCNTSTATEIANGAYFVPLAASDTNGASIIFRFSAPGAQDLFYTAVTQP